MPSALTHRSTYPTIRGKGSLSETARKGLALKNLIDPRSPSALFVGNDPDLEALQRATQKRLAEIDAQIAALNNPTPMDDLTPEGEADLGLDGVPEGYGAESVMAGEGPDYGVSEILGPNAAGSLASSAATAFLPPALSFGIKKATKSRPLLGKKGVLAEIVGYREGSPSAMSMRAGQEGVPVHFEAIEGLNFPNIPADGGSHPLAGGGGLPYIPADEGPREDIEGIDFPNIPADAGPSSATVAPALETSLDAGQIAEYYGGGPLAYGGGWMDAGIEGVGGYEGVAGYEGVGNEYGGVY